jgi:hypothetical protein
LLSELSWVQATSQVPVFVFRNCEACYLLREWSLRRRALDRICALGTIVELARRRSRAPGNTPRSSLLCRGFKEDLEGSRA